jgi:hypothetical protein
MLLRIGSLPKYSAVLSSVAIFVIVVVDYARDTLSFMANF